MDFLVIFLTSVLSKIFSSCHKNFLGGVVSKLGWLVVR